MKSFASTLTTAAAVSALTISTASASSYQAICVFDELKCGGSIKLREYTPDASCSGGDCAALTSGGLTTFSYLPTCTEDHVKDTDKHLKGYPYVLVENYAAGTACGGDFVSAIAVVADGTCYPGSAGTSSYAVTQQSDLSVTWLQYTDAKCASNATQVNFTSTQVDRATCVKDTMKVLAVDKDGATTATTMPPSSNGSPAPTSGGSVVLVTLLPALAGAAAAWSLV